MNKTLTALKLAEEALNAMLTNMGMDEDEWTKPTFNQAREALSAIREALAEPVKQEPVAVVDEIGKRLDGTNIFNAIGKVDVGQPLYAAPVDAKATRAEALEEAAKWFEGNEDDVGYAIATEIRGLK